jgi:UDP-3-O-[3-hydroxymyristoyl] glucosamine N-acyltransferase
MICSLDQKIYVAGQLSHSFQAIKRITLCFRIYCGSPHFFSSTFFSCFLRWICSMWSVHKLSDCCIDKRCGRTVSRKKMSKFPFFNSSTLELGDVTTSLNCTLLRDGEFANLGMFRNFGTQMLTVLHNPKFLPQLEANLANFSAIVTTPELSDQMPAGLGVMTHEKPLEVFVKLHEYLFTRPEPFYWNTPQPTLIAASAKIHPTAIIAPTDVVIEDDVVIEPYAVIYDRTRIGARSFIGPHVTIGGPGFEMRIVDGKPHYVSHAGGVDIGEDCHIFAHASIARAVFGGPTTIGAGCKIDHFVHIAHAAQIGASCRLVAGASIGGATRVGDGSWVGPNAVIANSLVIGDNAWIAMGASCAQDVASGQRVGGPFSRVMP